MLNEILGDQLREVKNALRARRFPKAAQKIAALQTTKQLFKEWINPEGKAVYFNSIQGWRIENLQQEESANATPPPPAAPLDNLETTPDVDDSEPDDLPF